MKKFLIFFTPLCLFIFIFMSMLFVKDMLQNFDLWYHIRAGEFILHHGIVHTYPFSESPHRLWYPSEWLFEVALYEVTKLLGLGFLPLLLTLLTLLQVGLFFFFVRKTWNLSLVWTSLISYMYFITLFSFFQLRPQIVADSFFLTTLFIILIYVKNNKNYLWVTLFTTLLWSNLHGSVIFAVYLFGAYALICIVFAFTTKAQIWIHKSTLLLIFTIATTLITLAPPLHTIQYQNDIFLLMHGSINQQMILEWGQLANTPLYFVIYTVSLIAITASTIFFVIRKKQWTYGTLFIPIIPFLIIPFIAERNIYFGYVSLFIMLASIITYIQEIKIKKNIYIFLFIILAIYFALTLWLFPQNFNYGKIYYPYRAAKFINKQDIQGNLFNEYDYGSYLLYALYPEHKVFIDGRTESYDCCELQTTYRLFKYSYLPNSEYKTILDDVWVKYNISFVVISIDPHSYSRKIAEILTVDPDWNLVYWDDTTQIFIKKDSRNDQLLKRFGTLAATPFGESPFRKGMNKQAMTEYMRMESITDSARSRNALGLLYFDEKQYIKAKEEFEMANRLDPTFDSPLMNLAELSIINSHDYISAIHLYKKALEVNPQRAYTYIRLGQLFEATHDTTDALAVWQKGVSQFSNASTQQTFRQLIQQAQLNL